MTTADLAARVVEMERLVDRALGVPPASTLLYLLPTDPAPATVAG